jgi:hypothetical protein
MGWGGSLTLSEIGYECFPTLPEILGQENSVVMALGSTDKAEKPRDRGAYGTGVGYCLTLCFPQVTNAVEALLSADSASRKQEVQAWDGEVRQVSKHAFNLKQLDNPARIPPW